MNKTQISAESSEEESLHDMINKFYAGQTVYAIAIDNKFFFFLDKEYKELVHQECISIHDIADISGDMVNYMHEKIKLLCEKIGLKCKLLLDSSNKEIDDSIINLLTNSETAKVELFSIHISAQYSQS